MMLNALSANINVPFLGFAIGGFQTPRLSVVAFNRVHTEFLGLNATAAACDLVIAATMTWLLYRARTGFGGSNTMANRMMVRSNLSPLSYSEPSSLLAPRFILSILASLLLSQRSLLSLSL